jgi:hypothetical protein
MMGDGENIDRVVKTGSMDDVGTRLQFLTELYDLWQEGIDILTRYDKHTPGYEDKKRELEVACRLLYYHMTKDFHEETYRKVVELLPWNAENIKDDNPIK